ncbi:hypothetical protein [Delftia tsuruhatensis]|uniref:hypothetical protein n=1 Tax=Delftia tsuruhatensis TaxID=180282 RepID=UPI0024475C14|nr:hypothetical protein [Delftia tsuruhatensis]MDH0423529.1 hypothetical protein [Delftia tsuruhatensis]
MELNRAQRRAAKKQRRPVRGAGHIQLPVNIRFNAEAETRLQLVPLGMATTLIEGTADETTWHTITMRINWGRFLAADHFPEAEPAMITAQDAMRSISARHDRAQTWVASKPEYDAVYEALRICNEMQQQCTRRELRDALERVYAANEYHRKLTAIKNRLDARA